MKRILPIYGFYIVFLLCAFVLTNCDNVQQTQNIVTTSIQPENFALNMIPGLIKSGLSDATTLEQRINDPNSGINNIDIDKDNRTDYVLVKESQDNVNRTLTFVAHPSGGGSPDVPFAVASFVNGTNDVQMQTGFLPSVSNYDSYYYHDTFARDMAFATWLYMASRPMYVPIMPRSYSYYNVRTPSAFIGAQRSYQSQTRIFTGVKWQQISIRKFVGCD